MVRIGDRTVPRCGRCVRAGRDCKIAFKFKASKGTIELTSTSSIIGANEVG